MQSEKQSLLYQNRDIYLTIDLDVEKGSHTIFGDGALSDSTLHRCLKTIFSKIQEYGSKLTGVNIIGLPTFAGSSNVLRYEDACGQAIYITNFVEDLINRLPEH